MKLALLDSANVSKSLKTHRKFSRKGQAVR